MSRYRAPSGRIERLEARGRTDGSEDRRLSGRGAGCPAPPPQIPAAAFPHRAPAEGRTRPEFGAWAAHTPPIRRLAASVTRRIRLCVRGMRCCLPSPRPAAFPPPSPPPTLRSALFEASQVLYSRPTPHLFPGGFVFSTSRRGP